MREYAIGRLLFDRGGERIGIPLSHFYDQNLQKIVQLYHVKCLFIIHLMNPVRFPRFS